MPILNQQLSMQCVKHSAVRCSDQIPISCLYKQHWSHSLEAVFFEILLIIMYSTKQYRPGLKFSAVFLQSYNSFPSASSEVSAGNGPRLSFSPTVKGLASEGWLRNTNFSSNLKRTEQSPTMKKTYYCFVFSA